MSKSNELNFVHNKTKNKLYKKILSSILSVFVDFNASVLRTIIYNFSSLPKLSKN